MIGFINYVMTLLHFMNEMDQGFEDLKKKTVVSLTPMYSFQHSNLLTIFHVIYLILFNLKFFNVLKAVYL